MSVWSDPGSPAALSGSVCTEPPLPSDNCPEAFALVNSWVQRCRESHELCRRTISETLVDENHGPKLPTRVLDVGCTDSGDISLLETIGQRGNYTALSYCWGPTGRQNLVTTRDNINDRLSGIKFGRLPKSFQDAVFLTRKIGIRYLWIDSLCIIQGDKADWTAESARMVEVYQKACLVIAASGGAHPGEGCFSSRSRCSTTVEIPHYSEAGQSAGSIRLSMCIPGENSPYWGPLNDRGWALQEWYLARRTLHFMPTGMSWKCRVLESGERYPLKMYQYPEWEVILQEYSNRQLTYKKDRLVALEGLGKAFQEAKGDMYSLGVHECGLPRQLLWTMKDEAQASEDLADVPSWSWASKGGKKIFWTTQDLLGEPVVDHTQMTIEGSWALKVLGPVGECKISSAEASETDEVEAKEQEFTELLSSVQMFRHGPLHWIESLSKALGIVGIAIFDNDYFGLVHLLFLAVSDREEYNSFKDAWGMSDPGRVSIESLSIQVLYGVLLLVPSADGADCFRRVGMGLVFQDPKHESILATLQTIYII